MVQRVPVHSNRGTVVVEYHLVSDEDYEWVVQKPWFLDKDGYARRSQGINGKCVTFLLHREIWKRVTSQDIPDGVEIDHLNRVKSDHRRENLRLANDSQQEMNKDKKRGGSSVYRGVSWRADRNRWKVKIRPGNGRPQIYLGSFVSEEDAARAYDKVAQELFGEYASLNFPNEG